MQILTKCKFYSIVNQNVCYKIRNLHLQLIYDMKMLSESDLFVIRNGIRNIQQQQQKQEEEEIVY